MEDISKDYLPAAGHDWALPLYDPLVKLLGGYKARKLLLDQAAGPSIRRVLDIGCGTGTLVMMMTKHLDSGVEVVGLDPDPKALSRARRKAQQEGLSIKFDQGYSEAPPYAAASFDRVFSSFMLHHLRVGQREKTLREARRVLAPGGSLHLFDFERPDGPSGRLSRWFHRSNHLDDNSEPRLLTQLREAGFVSPTKLAAGVMLFGFLRLGYYRATCPRPTEHED
jgi:ubiquinone/menaquinone biosynthesis C-methylase UbiE